MSKLRPHGVKVDFNGEEREFLFTLNVIDELQSTTEKSLADLLREMLDSENGGNIAPVKKIVSVLLQDETERAEFLTGDKKKSYTEKQVGWIITLENYSYYMEKILEAYGISMPSGDEVDEIEDEIEEDDDPNATRATEN